MSHEFLLPPSHALTLDTLVTELTSHRALHESDAGGGTDHGCADIGKAARAALPALMADMERCICAGDTARVVTFCRFLGLLSGSDTCPSLIYALDDGDPRRVGGRVPCVWGRVRSRAARFRVVFFF